MHNCRLCTFNDGAREERERREREREREGASLVAGWGCWTVGYVFVYFCDVPSTYHVLAAQNGNTNGTSTMQRAANRTPVFMGLLYSPLPTSPLSFSVSFTFYFSFFVMYYTCLPRIRTKPQRGRNTI